MVHGRLERADTPLALGEIMQWAEVRENGEVMTLLIHPIHESGPEAARHFLYAPRQEIAVSDFVARRLDQFYIGRELLAPDLMLGDDPDDTGLLLLANAWPALPAASSPQTKTPPGEAALTDENRTLPGFRL